MFKKCADFVQIVPNIIQIIWKPSLAKNSFKNLILLFQFYHFDIFLLRKKCACFFLLRNILYLQFFQHIASPRVYKRRALKLILGFS